MAAPFYSVAAKTTHIKALPGEQLSGLLLTRHFVVE
jgi:hypothetical protein